MRKLADMFRVEKTGNWVPVNVLTNPYRADEWRCSCCGRIMTLLDYSRYCGYTYCPWCGAWMENAYRYCDEI